MSGLNHPLPTNPLAARRQPCRRRDRHLGSTDRDGTGRATVLVRSEGSIPSPWVDRVHLSHRLATDRRVAPVPPTRVATDRR